MTSAERERIRTAAGPGPVTCTAAGQPGPLWWLLGLGLGAANAVRHRTRGYRTPRPFPVTEIERSVDYVIGVLDRWQADGRLDVTGRRVLEVGPGPDLGTGAALLARGARSYTAADLFPLAGDTDEAFYTALGDRLAIPVDRTALDYRVTDFPAMSGLSGPYDLILSNAALEHFTDIPATFARLADLAAPGALMCHHVDGMTHMRGIRSRDPLNLLRQPRSLYRLVSFPGIPNRLRAGDYVTAAEAAGWSVQVVPGLVAPDAYVRKSRRGMAHPYRRYALTDLALLTFTLVCKR